MGTKRFASKTKIYIVPDVGELRRIRRPDGISFMTSCLQEHQGDARPVSVEVEFLVTNRHGTLLISMRRIPWWAVQGSNLWPLPCQGFRQSLLAEASCLFPGRDESCCSTAFPISNN